jgi:two-component system, NarL family, nitrate/nitrite response regulator NarL
MQRTFGHAVIGALYAPRPALGREAAMMNRVLIASDVRLYRDGLELLLRDIETIVLVGSAATAADAAQAVRTVTPDIVLLDMSMSEAFSVAKHVARSSKEAKIVALAMPEVESDVLTCAEIGIAGYVSREGSLTDVVAAITAASHGEVRCSPKIAGLLFRRVAALSTERRGAGLHGNLTAREAQIVRLLQQGLSNKMISRSLGIELATVKNHVHSILAKLGVHRRAEAVSLLQRREPSELS